MRGEQVLQNKKTPIKNAPGETFSSNLFHQLLENINAMTQNCQDFLPKERFIIVLANGLAFVK
jgi:hypothetical protein